MCNTKDLTLLCNGVQLFADSAGGTAADTGIDFVEYYCDRLLPC